MFATHRQLSIYGFLAGYYLGVFVAELAARTKYERAVRAAVSGVFAPPTED